LPPVGALDQLRERDGVPPTRSAGAGIVDRLRSNRGLTLAVVGGALLLIAWIAWAIYVTSDKGATAGLGVVIAWPVLLAALALISLPFIGAFRLVRRLNAEEGSKGAAPSIAEALVEEGPTNEEDSSDDEEDSEDPGADEE
jgi:hypothetical protein